MRVKRIFSAFIITIVLLSVFPTFAAAETDFRVDAKSAVLMEVTTNKILFAQSEHQVLPMASTTKIMTALLAIENASVDDMITVPSEAYGSEGSSMYLEKGEVISLKDLLYGLMLMSGNDAAITIASYIGGSVERFAQMMNSRAKQLGANNTNFVTPNGLPDKNHYTTAYDLTLIASEAMKNEIFREIASTEYYRTTTGNVIRTMKNKNKLLWQYDGGIGIKTGYTVSAGKCLVFAAQKQNMMLIGTVLNCQNMFPVAMTMLNYGYDNYRMQKTISAGEPISYVSVKHGFKNVLELTVNKDIMVPAAANETPDIETRVFAPSSVDAPVEANANLGYIELWQDGKYLLTSDLFTTEESLRRDFKSYFNGILMGW